MQTVSLFGNTAVSKSFMRPFIEFFNLKISSGGYEGWCILPGADSYVF